VRRALLTAILAITLVAPRPGTAAEPLSWETGEGKSYVIPALEIGGFLTGLNQFNRHVIDSKEYGSDGHSIWRNLRGPLVIDKDPFSINQLGHPYQGNIYFGFARSAGLDFWRSLAYSVGGSLLWETAGETTPPALNDHINTAIGGAFIGEAAFRMASLLLEGGGEKPGFWRELGAAILSPPTGFNRLAFGDRFDAVFPSRNPEVFIRLRLGATLTNEVNNPINKDVKRQEGAADYSITYGLPGKPGYQYKRPFDYFHFEFTAVPNAGDITDAIENVSIRGLLGGVDLQRGRRPPRRVGRLRQLRLFLAADLPGVEHRGIDGHRLPVVAHAPPRAAGHRARWTGPGRGGYRRRPGRARLSLWPDAADPAGSPPHLR
jgi:Domain of unknown function (DUF3943)